METDGKKDHRIAVQGNKNGLKEGVRGQKKSLSKTMTVAHQDKWISKIRDPMLGISLVHLTHFLAPTPISRLLPPHILSCVKSATKQKILIP